MASGVVTYRLQRSRLWLALTGLATTLGVLVFAHGWRQVPDRPWFAIALLLTLGVGTAFGWIWLRRWHTLTVTPEPPRLRVQGMGRARDFDLAGADLHQTDFVVTGRARVPVGQTMTTVATSGHRSALAIRTPRDSLVVHGRSGRARQVAALAGELSHALGVEVSHSTARRGRSGFARYVDGGRPTVNLNPDLGGNNLAALVGLALAGVMLLMFAPVALLKPSYAAAVVDTPEDVIATWTEHLRVVGATPDTDPGAVDVDAQWQVCEHSPRWFWGESDAARLDLQVGLPVAAGEVEALQARLDELLERSDPAVNTWRDPDLRRTVELADGQLTTRLSHPCLHGDGQRRAEEELSSLAAVWLSWLADTSER